MENLETTHGHESSFSTLRRWFLHFINKGIFVSYSFTELVVGAPGGGRPDGTGGSDMTGAVYVYYGRPEGLDSARPQVIYGSDLAVDRLSRFGGAISGGESWDMDGNGYGGKFDCWR